VYQPRATCRGLLKVSDSVDVSNAAIEWLSMFRPL
jgi:hypothetical protein